MASLTTADTISIGATVRASPVIIAAGAIAYIAVKAHHIDANIVFWGKGLFLFILNELLQGCILRKKWFLIDIFF